MVWQAVSNLSPHSPPIRPSPIRVAVAYLQSTTISQFRVMINGQILKVNFSACPNPPGELSFCLSPVNVLCGYQSHVTSDVESCFQCAFVSIDLSRKLYGFLIMPEKPMGAPQLFGVLIHEGMKSGMWSYSQKQSSCLVVLSAIHSGLTGVVTPYICASSVAEYSFVALVESLTSSE